MTSKCVLEAKDVLEDSTADVNTKYRADDLNNVDFLKPACTTYGPAKPFVAVLEMISCNQLKLYLFLIYICRIVM